MSFFNIVNPFATVEVEVPLGETIAIKTNGFDDVIVKSGEFNINGTTAFGYLDTVQPNTEKVYGPYSSRQVFEISAGSTPAYYNTGTNASALSLYDLERSLDLDHEYFNDFDTFTAADWTVTLVGTGTTALADGDGGLLEVATSATINDSTYINKVGESFRFEPGKQLIFASRLKIDQATNSVVVAGLQITDTTPEDVTDGVFFFKQSGIPSFDLLVEKDDTATTTSTGVTLTSDTFISLIFWYDGNDAVNIYVDGVWVAQSDVTNLPDDEDLTLSFGIRNTTGAPRTLTVDYLKVSKQR